MRGLGSAPEASSEATSRAMKGNASRDTRPELAVRELLRDLGYPGYRLQWRTTAGRIDIAFPGRRVAIFVQGCFWHRCQRCSPGTPKSNIDFWRAKFRLNVERDAKSRAALEDEGWDVLYVWECEIRDTPEAVASRLSGVLDTSARRAAPQHQPS